MITKGYIEKIENNYTVKVRIPVFNKSKESNTSTPTNELNNAYFSVMPNSRITPQVGDAVIVAFENNDFAKPVIIGYLYNESRDYSVVDSVLQNLFVGNQAKLPSNTEIGSITSKQLSFLSNISSDVQVQLDTITYQLDQLKSAVSQLKK